MTLHRVVLRGAAWTAAGTIFVQALGFITALVAARVLGPQPYGLLGMALVVTALGTTAYDLALAPAIASGRILDERTVMSAHWLLCGIGGLVAVVVVVLAPAAASFFGAPILAEILRALAPTLLFGAAAVVPQALLQRESRFRALAFLRALNQVVVTACVLVLVLLRSDVWVLVVPGVVASALMVPAYWVGLGRTPALVLEWNRLVPFLREGAHLSGYNLCNYFARNADNAIIGKLSGERALGLYAFAYNLLARPLEIFSHSLVPALIPSFGRLRGDTARISQAAVQATLGGLRLGAPAMIGGALTADVFVPLLFGMHWEPAIPLVRILMVTGALQIPGPVFGSMVMASGNSAFALRWGIGTAVLSTSVFFVGAFSAAALGVAVAYLAYTAALVLVMFLVARSWFGLPLEGLPSGLASLLRDVLSMVVAVVATSAGLRGLGVAGGVRFGIEVAVGAIVYVGAFRVFAPREAAALLQVLPRPVAALGAQVLRLRYDSQVLTRF